MPEVRTVACIGAGVIGGGWAAYFLARGFDVVALGSADDAEARLRRTVDAAWPALFELGLDDSADRTRLRVAGSLAEACRDADFVQESAPEDLELKRRLLADLVAATKEDVVVASSTSGFPMSEMATAAADPSASSSGIRSTRRTSSRSSRWSAVRTPTPP